MPSSILLIVAFSIASPQVGAEEARHLEPGTYWQEDACTRIPLSGDSGIRWCVPSLTVTTEATLEVKVEWDVGPNDRIVVEWEPLDGNRNVYLLDAVGRRYDHSRTRRGAAFGGRLSRSPPHDHLDGSLIFHLPPASSGPLTLYDDDHHLRIDGLRFEVARRTSPEQSRRILGDLSTTTRIKILREREGISPRFSSVGLDLVRVETGFGVRIVHDTASVGPVYIWPDWDPAAAASAERYLSFETTETFLEALNKAPLLPRDPPHPCGSLVECGAGDLISLTTSDGVVVFADDTVAKIPTGADMAGETFQVMGPSVADATKVFLEAIDPSLPTLEPPPEDTMPRAPRGTDLRAERPLRLAIQRGDDAKLEKLLDQGADPNIRFLWDGETPVTVATMHHRPRMIELLIDRGADPNTTTARRTALAIAAKRDDLESARALLEGGGDPRIRSAGWSAIDIAVYYRRDEVTSLFLSHLAGQPLGLQEMSLLHAIRRGEVELVSTLLAAGADPNPPVTSLLEEAVLSGDQRLVRLLLEHGARPEVRPLVAAVSRDDVPMVKLLLDGGADAGARTYHGQVPLMRAASPEMVEVLVEAGADPNSRDDFGWTVLKRLVLLGTRPKTEDPQSLEKRQAILRLLRYGADIRARDDDGKTALDHARLAGLSKIEELLLAAMTQPDPG